MLGLSGIYITDTLGRWQSRMALVNLGKRWYTFIMAEPNSLSRYINLTRRERA